MDMATKPLQYNSGYPQYAVFWPNCRVPDQYQGDVNPVINMIDRGGSPKCGDGPVFIAHHSSLSVPFQGNDVRVYSSSFYPDGYKDCDLSQLCFSGASESGGLLRTHSTINSFEYVGWCTRDRILYEFCLHGTPLSFGVPADQPYSYDGLYEIIVTRCDQYSQPLEAQRQSQPRTYSYVFGGTKVKGESFWQDALKSEDLGAIYARICAVCPTLSWMYTAKERLWVVDLSNMRQTSGDAGSFRFEKSQYSFWLNRVYDMPGVVGNLYNAGFYQAFYQAIDKLPHVTQNPLANIVDIVSTLRSFRAGYKSILGAKELFKEAWLSYRYAYSTTKSDIIEITSVLTRLSDIAECGVVRSYGHVNGKDGDSFDCAIVCDMSQSFQSSLSKFTKEFNFRLSLLNLWDMIPYSFVVDWFFGISEVLEDLDQWLMLPEYSILEVWYSYHSVSSISGAKESVYFRWEGHAPSLPYVHHSTGVSDVTIVKRGLDMLALLIP